LDIIKKYEDQIDYWVSERDKGIYDAMNKGIDAATGEWINFMNAGDKLITIPNLGNLRDIALVYGNVILSNNKIYKYNKNIKFEDFSRGMVVCHQACFYNKNYYKISRYDLKYKLCGDQKYTALAVKSNTALYIDKVVAFYDLNGISSQSNYHILKEKIKLNFSLGLNIFNPFISTLITGIIKIKNGF